MSTKSLLVWALGSLSFFVISCAEKPEIDPDAVRLLKTNIDFSSQVGLRLTSQSKGAFSGDTHCVQWIRYVHHGKTQAERIEIGNKACPSGLTVFPAEQRVGQLKFTSVTTTLWRLFQGDSARPFGEFSQHDDFTGQSFLLDHLCDDSFAAYCDVNIDNAGAITGFQTK